MNTAKPQNDCIDMTKAELAAAVSAALAKLYPDAVCALRYDGEPWRLLVMAILSAQCTDKRVNAVSEQLFAVYPTAQAMATADISQLEELIRSCGLYKTKAKNLKLSCAALCDRFGGTLPSDMDSLLSLPGVGRKIANLVRGDIFGLGGIVADTHCIRLSARIGFTDTAERDPLRTERALSPLIPPTE